MITQSADAEITATELTAQIPLHTGQVVVPGGNVEGVDHDLGRLIRRQGRQKRSPQLPPALAGKDVLLQLGPQQRSGFTAQAFDHVAKVDPPQPALVSRAVM